jgi:hypothetical protein
MMTSIVSVAILCLLAGCSGLGTGFGAASVGASQEREASMMYLWGKRGADAGDLARAYCVMGSARERGWMRQQFENHAVPAVVTIHCPDE